MGPPPLFPQSNYDAVVIAASQGGLNVLRPLVAALPQSFPAAVLLVLHTDPRSPSWLPAILARDTRLKVVPAGDRMPLGAGTVFVAPPGRHLLVAPHGRCTLSDALRVNFTRPAADTLFSSAARSFGARTLGVILTGRLYDGTRGALDIRSAGGVVLAQQPETCEAPDMPRSAIRAGAANFVLEPARIAAALVSLVMCPGVPALFGVGSTRRTA